MIIGWISWGIFHAFTQLFCSNIEEWWIWWNNALPSVKWCTIWNEVVQSNIIQHNGNSWNTWFVIHAQYSVKDICSHLYTKQKTLCKIYYTWNKYVVIFHLIHVAFIKPLAKKFSLLASAISRNTSSTNIF